MLWYGVCSILFVFWAITFMAWARKGFRGESNFRLFIVLIILSIAWILSLIIIVIGG